jgi:hypothetical protein
LRNDTIPSVSASNPRFDLAVSDAKVHASIRSRQPRSHDGCRTIRLVVQIPQLEPFAELGGLVECGQSII